MNENVSSPRNLVTHSVADQIRDAQTILEAAEKAESFEELKSSVVSLSQLLLQVMKDQSL